MSPTFDIDHVVARCATLGPAQIRPVRAVAPDNVRHAAILVPVVERDGQACVVVTRRSQSMPTHKGDWVFPGGGVSRGDTGPREAAVRETAEELGVDPARVTVLGALDGYGPIPTGHVVHVFVGVLIGLEFAPDPTEVVDVEIVPIATFYEPERHLRAIGWPEGYEPAPPAWVVRGMAESGIEHDFFEIRRGHLLWGGQAVIMKQLLDLLDGGSARLSDDDRPSWMRY